MRSRRALPTVLALLAALLGGLAGLTPAAAQSATLDVGTGSISGRITVPAGVDPTHVMVNVWHEINYSGVAGYGFPSADGTYSVSGLPAGRYRVEFIGTSDGLVRQYWNGASFYDKATMVTVGSGPVTGIDASLTMGASVYGTIHTNGWFDLTKVRVHLMGAPGQVIPDAWVMPDGRWSIRGLPTSSYWVWFEGAGAGLPSLYWNPSGGSPDQRYSIPLTAGQSRTGIDITLNGPIGAISGRVTMPPGGDPTAILVSATGAGHRTTHPFADGTFRLDAMPAGWYYVSFALGDGPVLEYWNNAPSTAGATAIPVTANQLTPGVDAYVAVPVTTEVWSSKPVSHVGQPVTLTARLTSASGTPYGRVEFSGPGGSLGSAPLNNGVGSVTVGSLPAGRDTVVAHFAGGGIYDASTGEATQWVSVPTTPAVSRLEPPAGSVVGGTRVRVIGSGFTDTYQVLFGGVPGTDITVLTPGELEVTAPGGPDGVVPVEVTSSVGTSAPSDGALFTFVRVVAQMPERLADWYVTPDGPRCVLLAGVAGVPDEATGVIVNVTTVRPTGPGYVVLYPDSDSTGQTPPPGSSTVNFEPGQDVANSAFVALPDDGLICYATKGASTAGVLLDVSGFTLDGSGIVTQLPQRLLDTRPAWQTGELTGPVTPRQVHTLQVAGRAGVPADAVAVLLNVTVTCATTVGNLRVFPGDQAVPDTSVVNFAPGHEKASATLVSLVDGKVSLYSDSPAPTSTSPVQAIIDVVGYLEVGSALETVTPTRLVDTRSAHHIGPFTGALAAGQVYSLPVAGLEPVPADATAVVLNVTAIGPTKNGNLRVYPDSGGDGRTAPPGSSSLNYVVGRDIPNQVVVALPADGCVDFYSDMAPGGTVHLAVDVVGYVSGA